MIILTVLVGCRKELCYDHFHEVSLHLKVTYSLDWYLPWEENWEENWPAEWVTDWDKILPEEPEGVRLHVFDFGNKVPVSSHNLAYKGGRVAMNRGCYDMLLYNNDAEGILFEKMHLPHEAAATTPARTRSAYLNRYPDEITASPPGILFAAFIPEHTLETPEKEEASSSMVEVELVPRTWTYLIRYEFTSGQEYVAEAQAYLSGMAGGVNLKEGYTHSDKVVTLLLDCSSSEYGIESIVRSFGLPGVSDQREEQRDRIDLQTLPKAALTNKLVLDMKLNSGKVKTMEFDVTEQLRKQPQGGVIVVKDIVVTPEEGQGSGGSGFDGDVNDWDGNIDIEVPIL